MDPAVLEGLDFWLQLDTVQQMCTLNEFIMQAGWDFFHPEETGLQNCNL